MKQIIAPIDRELLLVELTPEKMLRKTNKAGNEIYVLNHHNAPNTMLEIGRLRELTFRAAGGGTGKEVDIDSYDTDDVPYEQLIVWNPDQQEILGGYRYILCKNLPKNEKGEVHLATSRLFKFSTEFVEDFLPYVIELGRSFVQPDYQSSKAGAKGLFALDNLWDGLGALMINHPEMLYFFGKVTMYTSYNVDARNLILYFFDRYFGDDDKLVYPFEPMSVSLDTDRLDRMFDGLNYDEGYKVLSVEVRKLGEKIPPLINAYMGLSPTMRTFGTVVNNHFGEVEETGIMIDIDEMYDGKINRHVSSYLDQIAENNEVPMIRFQ
ncbi:GNAT family N-acetyltransferase [Halosquirtibacter laminarini]|uniref:GNAT family N-acetyltransferase n=1 Tax=Halosquirtibacter laminarini TaxID=3374600 RepID=A0AC61NMK0_9BACT|nr:GNAT family N-acetyltransferase [Prolixibacteraceae bacterium]